ncbi:unnamed protein product [Eretmochelys imbricata]
MSLTCRAKQPASLCLCSPSPVPARGIHLERERVGAKLCIILAIAPPLPQCPSQRVPARSDLEHCLSSSRIPQHLYQQLGNRVSPSSANYTPGEALMLSQTPQCPYMDDKAPNAAEPSLSQALCPTCLL